MQRIFVHWIRQLIIAKITASKFLCPRSKYALFSDVAFLKVQETKKTLNVYMLECISKGYQLLRNGHMDEEDFGKLVKESGMIRRMLEEITDSSWGIYFSH